MRLSQITLLLSILLIGTTGCIDVDYVGQKFAPLPEDASVRVFKEAVDFPQKEYKVIGRATITAPDDTSSVDMWDEVMEQARECGANGVKIVSSKRELVSSHQRQPVADGRRISSASGGGRGLNSMGGAIQVNSFGETVNGNSATINSYEMVLKVLLLKDSTSFDQEMAKRDDRIKDLTKKTE